MNNYLFAIKVDNLIVFNYESGKFAIYECLYEAKQDRHKLYHFYKEKFKDFKNIKLKDFKIVKYVEVEE